MKNTKKSLVTLLGTCGVALALLALPARGQGLGIDRGPYVNFGAGINWMSAEFQADVGMRLSAAVGYDFNKWTGLELETGFLYNQNVGSYFGASGANLGQVPVLVNFVLRYENPSKVVPYVGFGVGGDFLFIGGMTEFDFAYQPMFGVRYEINEHMSVGLGYKYLGSATAAAFGFMEGNHGILAEFNWKF